MRTSLNTLVSEQLARGNAVPAFTCYDFTTALAVVAEAESAGRGVILLVAPKTAASTQGLRLVTALRTLADAASVPVSVQLDHASDIPTILAGIEAGADSVLADGSSLDINANIALVRAVRDAIADPSVVIEAELGGLAGDEDRAFAAVATGLTAADQVAGFVRDSGAQLLAVAVGNVHGKYAGEPNLRWDLLEQISAVAGVPLVLHGASGIPADDLARTPAFGVGKVNFNTELRTSVLHMLENEIGAHRADGENLLGLVNVWQNTVREFTGSTLRTLSAE
ncbi:fructose-bisphosphate aldolase [Arthrobacter alpinus]|uniref:class II fructose-bisphosphate aldolase n=1 Tax=Arthrobacter alpinus TaxID=656366 RepID=UPI0005C855A7|nr:class II fructose-bisphosphate aldolase [Arthrobacter alpinus]ALV44375.1 fructose-bisphosphate aldolase [Arthrobacter alpinus]